MKGQFPTLRLQSICDLPSHAPRASATAHFDCMRKAGVGVPPATTRSGCKLASPTKSSGSVRVVCRTCECHRHLIHNLVCLRCRWPVSVSWSLFLHYSSLLFVLLEQSCTHSQSPSKQDHRTN